MKNKDKENKTTQNLLLFVFTNTMEVDKFNLQLSSFSLVNFEKYFVTKYFDL